MIPGNVFEFLFNHTHSVHTGGEEGVEPPTKPRGLVLGKRGVKYLMTKNLINKNVFLS